jgi:hypothetical protein
MLPLKKIKGDFFEITNIGENTIFGKRCIHRTLVEKTFIGVKLKGASNSEKFNRIIKECEK